MPQTLCSPTVDLLQFSAWERGTVPMYFARRHDHIQSTIEGVFEEMCGDHPSPCRHFGNDAGALHDVWETKSWSVSLQIA